MIEASKSSWFDRVFYYYNLHYLLRRHFHYAGFQGMLDPYPNRGILYVMNHSSWWDGLIAYHVFHSCSYGDHYVMMDEQQLRNYRFFRKMGAYSINKSSPAHMIPSLRYTVSLLQSGKRVWMYPQGDIHHLEHRPLEVMGGAAHVLRKAPDTVVIPVTAYYSMYQHQKPEVTLMAGSPLEGPWNSASKEDITDRLQQTLQRQLDSHKRRIIYGEPLPASDFLSMLPAGKSTDQTFLTFKEKVSRWKSFLGS
ncbi:lysophospholipid acyltransferase family protein [Paenibacillus sp. GCM10023252]|uniref:lysophospholipid acyltransferase family protein n=1 Tax=Paenibacillus sp. GCM10023252 TaxID=3252649 RepID=UPI00361AF489